MYTGRPRKTQNSIYAVVFNNVSVTSNYKVASFIITRLIADFLNGFFFFFRE